MKQDQRINSIWFMPNYLFDTREIQFVKTRISWTTFIRLDAKSLRSLMVCDSSQAKL